MHKTKNYYLKLGERLKNADRTISIQSTDIEQFIREFHDVNPFITVEFELKKTVSPGII